ncbi:MAG: hypothetical protein ACPIOQ_32675 [Promethearchaeia archaeon]
MRTQPRRASPYLRVTLRGGSGPRPRGRPTHPPVDGRNTVLFIKALQLATYLCLPVNSRLAATCPPPLASAAFPRRACSRRAVPRFQGGRVAVALRFGRRRQFNATRARGAGHLRAVAHVTVVARSARCRRARPPVPGARRRALATGTAQAQAGRNLGRSMGERRSLLDTDRQDRLHIDATGHRAVTAALQHGLKEEDGPHWVSRAFALWREVLYG